MFMLEDSCWGDWVEKNSRIIKCCKNLVRKNTDIYTGNVLLFSTDDNICKRYMDTCLIPPMITLGETCKYLVKNDNCYRLSIGELYNIRCDNGNLAFMTTDKIYTYDCMTVEEQTKKITTDMIHLLEEASDRNFSQSEDIRRLWIENLDDYIYPGSYDWEEYSDDTTDDDTEDQSDDDQSDAE